MENIPAMQLARLQREGQRRLQEAGLSGAGLDADLLLGYCLGMTRTELYVNAKIEVGDSDILRFRSFLERRAAREPLAYITGEREFWSLPFHVDPAVLIPRPETEFLLEVALRHAPRATSQWCLDLCCGSGVIAIVLALELGCRVLAVDCSREALRISRQNSQRHGVEPKIRFLCSDLLEGVSPAARFSLIVSNPPYVSQKVMSSMLEPEVAKFEPVIALDGGEDGMAIIERLSVQVLRLLSPGGMFFMEFGADQGKRVRSLFSGLHENGRFFERVEILADYSQRDRVLFAKINDYNE